MGTAKVTTTMNTIAFFGLFFCFSLFIGHSLSLQCYSCVGALGEGKCDDANPGEVTDCSEGDFAPDYCVLKDSINESETRSCGLGDIVDDTFKGGCTEDTSSGTTLRFCICKGELCNETWKKAGWVASSSSSMYMASSISIFFIVSLLLLI